MKVYLLPIHFKISNKEMTKKKPMFRSPVMTSKAALERAATIRRQNVQRHQIAAAKNNLRDSIARDTANRNYQFV